MGGTWSVVVVVALGSAAGGVVRYVMSEAVTRAGGEGFPFGTLFVNLVGSVAIGWCVALSADAGSGGWTPVTRHAVMTGFLGGFTTFSSFSAQTFGLIQQGQVMAAAANVVASVVLGVAGCGVGYVVGGGGGAR